MAQSQRGGKGNWVIQVKILKYLSLKLFSSCEWLLSVHRSRRPGATHDSTCWFLTGGSTQIFHQLDTTSFLPKTQAKSKKVEKETRYKNIFHTNTILWEVSTQKLWNESAAFGLGGTKHCSVSQSIVGRLRLLWSFVKIRHLFSNENICVAILHATWIPRNSQVWATVGQRSHCAWKQGGLSCGRSSS